MSVLPYVFDVYPSSNHWFGSGCPDWFLPVERTLHRSLSNTGNYLRTGLSRLSELEKQAHIGKDGFQVCLDVQHFQPNEISVKTENDFIVVNAKHEEKKDEHGYITREFTRRYELPKGFKVEDVTSSLSSDGVLTIKCPHAPTLEVSKVRQIEIQQTGPAMQNIKANEEKKEEKKDKKTEAIEK